MTFKPQAPPHGEAGGTGPPPSAPVGADWRPLLDLIRAHDDEPRFTTHRLARVVRLQNNAARRESRSGRAA